MKIYYRFTRDAKKPVYFNAAGFEAELNSMLLGTIQEATKAISKKLGSHGATRTWQKEHRPKYETSVRISKSSIIVNMNTDNEIFRYVNDGTDIRYATMTTDFKAKSIPNTLTSRKGRGGMRYVSTRHPRPGIAARNFEKTAAEEVWPEYRKIAHNTYINVLGKYYRRAIGIAKQVATKRAKGIY